MYHNRFMEQKLAEIAKFNKIVLLVGARQVGKSTLLQHLFPHVKRILFDPVQDFYNVKDDPDLFLNNFSAPLILDEIQFVTELLPALKRRVDQSNQVGQYYLTGSQNLSMMQQVSESLAGRVAILQLGSMTPSEIINQENTPWLFSYLLNAEQWLRSENKLLSTQQSLFEMIWRGGLPGILEMPNELLPNYFSSYVQTYLERDIRLIDNIKDLHQFDRYISLASALTSQEINYSQLGREIGLTPQVAKHWMALLMYSYQWQEISPYCGNTIKRLSKRCKGYMMDTGLACYLQRIGSPEALARHPSLGALFETYIVNNLIRMAQSLYAAPQFYHWRTNGGAEVDIIMERDGCFYPVEIKCKSLINKHDARGIHMFYETFPHLKIMPGLIIYAGNERYAVSDRVFAVPWHSL
ncbi:MAG: GTP-binding protein [Gammaproteobacteria bacterium]|nr:GTP-binding protein [Gammaproteobacteria bacterium]